MKTFAPVTPDHTSGAALAVILTHNLDALLCWEEAAHDWADIEGVHQVRVAFRRMRSALVVFRRILPKDQRKAWAHTIEELVAHTGPARDLDVLIEEALPAFAAAAGAAPHPGARAVLEALTHERHAAYENVRTMLAGAVFKAFRQDFARWAETGGWRKGKVSQKKRERQKAPVAGFAARQLDTHHQQVLERGADTDPDDAAAMHKLRIACKKLRYATEFFTPLFAGMDAYTANLKALQDTLGHLHDTAVMSDLLRDLLNLEAHPQAEQFIDAVIAWRAREDQEVRRHFARQWHDFKDGPCPWRT